MAREIEEYLLTKFQKSLETKASNGNGSKRIPLFGKFQEIEGLLQKFRSSISTEPADKPIPLAKEMLYRLNDMLSECQMLSAKHGLYSPQQFLEIRSMSHKLSTIKAELNKALTSSNNGKVGPEANDANGVASSSHPQPRESTEIDGRSEVYGFNEQLAYLNDVLLNDQVRFKPIAIVGNEGLGKTTLCKKVYDQPEVKEYFNPRIWISMPTLPGGYNHCDDAKDTRTALVKKMLGCLGVDSDVISTLVSEGRGLSGLLFALFQELAGKRYLIVLDDFRETDVEWYGLKKKQKNSSSASSLMPREKWDGSGLASGLPRGWGGRVVVTCRSENVATGIVGDENLCHMLPLTGCDSCWNIFLDEVDRNWLRLCPIKEEDLRKEVEERCGGVPLGAKIMGEVIRSWTSPSGDPQTQEET